MTADGGKCSCLLLPEVPLAAGNDVDGQCQVGDGMGKDALGKTAGAIKHKTVVEKFYINHYTSLKRKHCR